MNYFGSGSCADCLMNHGHYCEVDSGQEVTGECPVWQEQVQLQGIRLLGPYWAKRNPGTGPGRN